MINEKYIFILYQNMCNKKLYSRENSYEGNIFVKNYMRTEMYDTRKEKYIFSKTFHNT